MAARTMRIGDMKGGVTVSIGYDDKSGAFTSIVVANPSQMQVQVTAGPAGKAQTTVAGPLTGVQAVAAPQPTFGLTSGQPNDLTITIMARV